MNKHRIWQHGESSEWESVFEAVDFNWCQLLCEHPYFGLKAVSFILAS